MGSGWIDWREYDLEWTTPADDVKNLLPAESPLFIGDHIVVSRGMYDHHGIVAIRPDGPVPGENGSTTPQEMLDFLADPWVIHYAPYKGTGSKNVIDCTPLADFSSGNPVKIDFHLDVGLLPPVEVVHRAMNYLDMGNYSLIDHNCEHFSSWCATGRFNSDQVAAVGGLITGSALFLGPIMLLPGLITLLGSSDPASHLDHCNGSVCERQPHPWIGKASGKPEDFDTIRDRIAIGHLMTQIALRNDLDTVLHRTSPVTDSIPLVGGPSLQDTIPAERQE